MFNQKNTDINPKYKINPKEYLDELSIKLISMNSYQHIIPKEAHIM